MSRKNKNITQNYVGTQKIKTGSNIKNTGLTQVSRERLFELRGLLSGIFGATVVLNLITTGSISTNILIGLIILFLGIFFINVKIILDNKIKG
jgi:hypothetical protein